MVKTAIPEAITIADRTVIPEVIMMADKTMALEPEAVTAAAQMAEITKELEWKTQEYSALITDSQKTSFGSGVLYYPGSGPTVYIFTCAHVIDELTAPIEVFFLCPIDRETETYKVVSATVDYNQIATSPIDETTVVDGVKYHSVDAAVISFCKDDKLSLAPTRYYVAEARRNDRVFAQGFPGGIRKKETLLEALDTAHGTVLHNFPDKHTFLLRVEDLFLDSGNRVYELQGFSGSPIWNSHDSMPCIVGLMTSGARETVYRSRVSAVKFDVVRSIMKVHFQVLLESRLPGIPKEDIAGGNQDFIPENSAKLSQGGSLYDEWLERQTEKVRAYIDDLKMKKAINYAKSAMEDERFNLCREEKIKVHMQHLLYCYEICLMDPEFEELERDLNRRGFFRGHDPLRWMTSCFGKRKFQETIDYAGQLLERGTDSPVVLQIAEMFRVISKAYTEHAPVEETLLQFLDEKENLKIKTDGNDTASLIYQMLGYVYGDCYKQYTKSVRCLNRSYQMGFNKVVMETLACSYYFLALQNSIREDDTVDRAKIDRSALYKARECFLNILEKADEWYLSGLLKRDGGVLFNTFFFLTDSYRVLTIYPLMRKYMPVTDKKALRDFELKYGKILCQGGRVDLSAFTELTREDRTLLDILGRTNEFVSHLEFQPPASLKDTQVEKGLRSLIRYGEDNLEKNIDPREAIGIRVTIMNLYGWGRRIFCWDVASQLDRHLAYIKETEDSKLIEVMENFRFENSRSLELAEERYITSWKQQPSLELWQELLNFYKRNWMLEKADAMFRDLFELHQDYVRHEPEYAYRAYIDYIVNYRRDIKDALRFFITHKAEMQDVNIAGFWELELMMYTNSFNDPERFESERLLFVEQGLLPVDEYHRTALIAYMCNLNSEKAAEHFNVENPCFGIFPKSAGISYLTREGAYFLVWQRKMPPHMEPDWNGMIVSRVEEIRNQYREETWHVPVEDMIAGSDFEVNKNIVMDGWALYFIAAEEKADCLEAFDTVYVTHAAVSRMMEEMCHYRNEYLESILAFLEVSDHVKIQSPDFEHQMLVREKAEYYEPGSAVAMALEAGCPAVIGEPDLGDDLIKNFRNKMIRPCDFEELME